MVDSLIFSSSQTTKLIFINLLYRLHYASIVYNRLFLQKTMSQNNFQQDLRKTRGKIKKSQIASKVKFIQPVQKKEYYLSFHNKIKVDYRNRQYKHVYEKLLKLDRPQQKYQPLYLEDLSYSVCKMLREHLVHKEVNTGSNVQVCILHGKDSITKLYKLFVIGQEVTNERKTVNVELQNNITRFLNVIITFIHKYALVSVIQNKQTLAKQLYDYLYSICTQIRNSATSNYKILRKVGESLLVYSVFLIDTKQYDLAIKILFQCIQNQVNLLIILSYRIKSKSKQEARRRKSELINRLYAIFFNLAYCFTQKGSLQWCYLCLRQCQSLSDLKINLIEKDIKINWQQIIKAYKNIYDEYLELLRITECYFDFKELNEEILILKAKRIDEKTLHQSQQKDLMSINSFPKSKVQFEKKMQKKGLRRSVSLQQNIEPQTSKTKYKDFAQQILFFGTNLFNKAITKQKKVYTSAFNIRSNHILLTQNQLAKSMKRQQENVKKNDQIQSKLKKKYKKVENTLFCKVKQPIQYEQLQRKFSKMMAEEQRQNNRCKQKRYLLRYKSQYINYKQLAQDNTNIYQQIQVIKTKNQPIIKEKKKVEVEEQEKQKKDRGIDLFKKIILKHAKKLEIKKSQTHNILKKKHKNRIQANIQSYTPAETSVNFLLDLYRKQKQKKEQKRKINKQEQYQKENLRYIRPQNAFLTKNTVQIPNLFISYIASSGFSCENPASLLQYGSKANKI